MSILVFWGLLAIGVVALVLVATIWSAGQVAKRRAGEDAYALPLGNDGALDDLVAPYIQQHPGASGLRLVSDPSQSFEQRLALTRAASRSLDLLYYIWDDDVTGRVLADAILGAADRGVRVRMLLDDVNVLNRDPVYRALDRHPRIEVRLFNPIRNRDKGFKRGIELLLNLLPYNRRMHGKLWIADGRFAITGGRNIGDEYFAAATHPKRNYHDLDILVAGELLKQAEAIFDQFWNSGIAQPIHVLWPGKKTRLRRFRARLAKYLREDATRRKLDAAGLAHADPVEPLAVFAPSDMVWSNDAQFLSDPPEKALWKSNDHWLPEALLPLLRSAQHSLRIMTPYFVPGPQGLAELIALAERGVKVEVITNGLAMADNTLVYGAYRWYRSRLLAKGVQIYEVLAEHGERRMLHSKAFLVDETTGFVGSFNFDLRSAFLNTELGVSFQDTTLIADLSAIMDAQSAPEAAFSVTQADRFPSWRRGAGKGTHIEPESNAYKRLVSFVVGHLPIHRFL